LGASLCGFSFVSSVSLCVLVADGVFLSPFAPTEWGAHSINQRLRVARLRLVVHPPRIVASFGARRRQLEETLHRSEGFGAIAPRKNDSARRSSTRADRMSIEKPVGTTAA